jgi:hypothetical protein
MITNQSVDVAEDPLVWFEANLRSAADMVKLTVANDADVTGATFRGGQDSASAKLNPSDLPRVKRAMRIGRYVVILGLLPSTSSLAAVRETLRRYRNQCVIARSFLSTNEALDLQLMLIGPRGSERDAEWRTLALMVERDDRVARKLAWLRPDDSTGDTTSFEDFLRRTFLARPWNNEGKFSVAALDRLKVERDTGDSGVPRNTADEWEAIALKREEDPSKLVNALIEAWKRRSGA